MHLIHFWLSTFSALSWLINLLAVKTWVWNCMLFQCFDWNMTHQVLFLYILLFLYTYLERSAQPALMKHKLSCRTDICSCKFCGKVSLMLEIHFQFHLFVNWTISAFVSSRLARKLPANSWFPSEKTIFF